MTHDLLAERDDEASSEPEFVPETPVAALRTCPERTVFSENGNADGWISTDLTVELER
ncbi:hypothetical protein [Halobaculum magnesiiphilum]|uniref:Uncharacterized protein n=1 Tax=Halobaculum magnesiiphilum TaxID=1017351 RepID=A0A8T8WHC5_9EURY|nr:hypothetical protein [Halobaculum magnesiiphilum]QZP39154.1 hypothetical protein K6T50_01710 [Halobaculum magnesiiphilum]